MALQIRSELLRNSKEGNLLEIQRLTEEYSVGNHALVKLSSVRNAFGDSLLSVAAAAGRVEVVEYYLMRFGEELFVDQTSDDGSTPLLNACLTGQFDTMALLLNSQADPNKARLDGVTPLIAACKYGHNQVANYLAMLASVDGTCHCQDGTNSLWYASLNGMSDVVAELISQKNVSVNEGRDDDCTPLLMAAGNGHLDVVRLLLSAGADPCLPRMDGTTPLHMACRRGHEDVVELLLRHDRELVGVTDKRGQTPLHRAARGGHLKVAQSLAYIGASVNSADLAGFCPLSEAAAKGHEAVVAWLLRMLDKQPSPIHTIECKVEDTEEKALPWNGNSALHLASAAGAKKVLERLLKSPLLQAELNTENLYGYTPLHLAVLRGHAHAVEVLVRFGADSSLPTRSSGENALQIALRNGNRECAKHFGVDQSSSSSSDSGSRPTDKRASARYLASPTAVTAPEPLAQLSLRSTIRPTLMFLSRRDLITAGKIPCYAACVKNDILSPASMVEATDQVLFISHRWDGENELDPTGLSHRIIVDFLRKEGRRIRWIWCTYCCLPYVAGKLKDLESDPEISERMWSRHSSPKNKASTMKDFQSPRLEGVKERKARLLDTAGALQRATHCLVLPCVYHDQKSVQNQPSSLSASLNLSSHTKPTAKKRLSDLECFMQSIQFYVEVLGSFISQSRIFCSFLVREQQIFHVKLVEPEFASSNIGFSKIANEMLKQEENFSPRNKNRRYSLPEHRSGITRKCCIVDSSWILNLLVSSFQREGKAAVKILNKSLRMELFKQSEIDAFMIEVPEIGQLWDRLGRCQRILTDERSAALSVLLYLVAKKFPGSYDGKYNEMLENDYDELNIIQGRKVSNVSSPAFSAKISFLCKRKEEKGCIIL
mmetsp:Transcript_19107/g.24718  ORF Transcript_19107/g.24718 Transcript_19107/m.24718 type:complete len:886 (-) Transcript_19107:111-2768(-)